MTDPVELSKQQIEALERINAACMEIANKIGVEQPDLNATPKYGPAYQATRRLEAIAGYLENVVAAIPAPVMNNITIDAASEEDGRKAVEQAIQTITKRTRSRGA